MPEHLVVIGATGSVGRRVVHFAALDARVSSVTALIRSQPRDLCFYKLSSRESDKLAQIRFDFASLKEHDPEEYKTTGLGAYTCGISCLGVYTAQVTGGAQEFMELEYAPNVVMANILRVHGVQRYAYLSGMGARQPPDTQEKPAFLQAMFSYVKGRTERDLSKVMPSFTTLRPGGILGRSETQSGLSGLFEKQLNSNLSWLAKTSYAIQCDDIAKAMLESVLQSGRGHEILENNEIKARASGPDT